MGTALLGLALASAVATAVMSLMTISALNRRQAMQNESKRVQEFRQNTISLVHDSMLYSRQNPAILPILKEAGFEPRPEVIEQLNRK